MQTQHLSSTSKPTNVVKSGSTPTKTNNSATKKTIRLTPWKIAELLICKRDAQAPVDVEHATDAEFQSWIEFNGIPVDENGIVGWNFDDRCMVINYVLAQGGTLQFVDGSTVPENNSESTAKPALQAE
jgi:hypothetical protein